MELKDFSIRLYNIQERRFRSYKDKQGEPPRLLFSFNLEWKGLIGGADPGHLDSYVGMTHSGCLLTVSPQGTLDWSPPKASSGRGFQLQPTVPNAGLKHLVLEALKGTEQAKILLDDYQKRHDAFLPGEFGTTELYVEAPVNG